MDKIVGRRKDGDLLTNADTSEEYMCEAEKVYRDKKEQERKMMNNIFDIRDKLN